ncbi:cyclophilin-like domain-containing protein [Powellomyces hirtus]|nr:cyclophilin-like domain-containing protein [Powellomyces hirtus]
MPATCHLPITSFAPAAAASTVTATTSDKLIVTGIISHSFFYKAKTIVEKLAARIPHLAVEVVPLPQSAFSIRRHSLKAQYQNLHDSTFPATLVELHTKTVTTTKGINKLKSVAESTARTLMTVPELEAWAEERGVVPDDHPDEFYEELVTKEHTKFLQTLTDPVMEIEFWHSLSIRKGDQPPEIKKQPLGPRLLVELFAETCPKTVAHFLSWVKGRDGMSYEKSLITRIVKGGWMECGEIIDHANHPIQAPMLEDENFIHHHDPYTLSYISSSKGPHTTTTPFLITLTSMPCFDKRYVAFGRVLEGLETLQAINDVKTMHEQPLDEVWIEHIKVWQPVAAESK